MDVVRARSTPPLVLLLLLLSACGMDNGKVRAESVEKPSAECASSALPNQFLVTWNDGSITVEQAEDRDALARDLLQPHLGEIVLAEHDQKVSLNEIRVSPKSSLRASSKVTPASDYRAWGHERIEAPSVWPIATGKDVIVAVVDSGVDVTHPQLVNQIAVNTKEIPGNGLDDDGNGYVDDVRGYDFEQKSGNVTDGSGHGTHVAGIIAAEHQSGNAMKGVAPDAKILPLDFMDDAGQGMMSDAIAAIQYAVSRGARVVNASWGGGCSKTLRSVVSTLGSRGVLFIAASGNGDAYNVGQDLEKSPTYPGAFGLPDAITVGASTYNDYMTSFSNYSRKLVHLVAPGQGVFSTYPASAKCETYAGSGYCYEDGTSMATPFVSGAAAVLWSHRPNATVAQIRKALLDGVDKGTYAVSTEGRLNLRKSLEALTVLVP